MDNPAEIKERAHNVPERPIQREKDFVVELTIWWTEQTK